MDAWIEFLRVAAASVFLFVAGPYWAARGNAVHVFVRAVFFFELTGLILGSWRMAHPGAFAFVTIVWLAAQAIFRRQHDWLYDGGVSPQALLHVMTWIEERRWQGLWQRWSGRLNGMHVGFGAVLLGMMTLTSLMAWLRFPLSNLRFSHGEFYWQAISLQTMMLGQNWMPDGSVAFLAPVGHLAGVDGSAVIRWIHPLASAGLAAAIAYCAWCWTGRTTPAWLAAAIYLLYRGFAEGSFAGSGKGELAALFWVIGAATFRASVFHGVASAVIALMIFQGFPSAAVPAFLVYPVAIPVGLGLEWIGSRLPVRMQTYAALATTVLICTVAYSRPYAAASEGPLQYESAARVASRIARERPRNSYMIVAPTSDLAMFLGHGWHLELSEFAAQSRDWPVDDPAFRFPFETAETFIFVEKEPLAQPAISAAMAVDTTAYHYYTKAGRTSLQFQIARTMASYARSHPTASVYYEDDRLIVYRAVRS